MEAKRFDAISKLFSARRLSRRQAIAQGGAGLAAGALAATGGAAASAQEATPDVVAPNTGVADRPAFLFIQSFQSGNIAAKEGEVGRYTLTLEQGLGQTIYFSDRPERVVGASPTHAFLEGLGFPDENPPNAALLLEPEPGNTEIAVLELFNPRYDEVSHTATYDVEILKAYERAMEMGFTEQPSDLSQMHSTFGAAHLFIDGCTSKDLICMHASSNGGPTRWVDRGHIAEAEFDGWCYRPGARYCLPCNGPETNDDAYFYWGDVCNKRFSDCNSKCRPESMTLDLPS